MHKCQHCTNRAEVTVRASEEEGGYLVDVCRNCAELYNSEESDDFNAQVKEIRSQVYQ
jgi:protein-arginine kinase activator protein McsA